MPNGRIGLALLLLLLGQTTIADTPPPQIFIESRIVITSNDFTRDLGIQWGSKRMSPDALDEVGAALGTEVRGNGHRYAAPEP